MIFPQKERTGDYVVPANLKRTMFFTTEPGMVSHLAGLRLRQRLKIKR
jgi:hypothetical protein